MIGELFADVTKSEATSPGKPYSDIRVTVSKVKDGRFRVQVTHSWGSNQVHYEELGNIKAGAFAWSISDAISDARDRANGAGIHGMLLEQALWAAEDAAEAKLAE